MYRSLSFSSSSPGGSGPSIGEPAGGISATRFGGIGGDIATMINVPLLKGRAALRFVGYGTQETGARQSIADWARQLSGCRLVVGVDTGLTHLAAAAGVPCVAIFVATDDSLFVPQQAERAGKVIKSVHDFLRRRDQAREPVAPQALVDAVMPLVTLQARKLGVGVVSRIPADLPQDRPLIAALAGKQIDMAIMSVQSSTPLVRQGRLKSLAVAGATRNKVTPDVPSVKESMPQYPSIEGFVSLLAPSSTPPALLAQIHAEMNKVLASEEYKKRLDSDGSTAKLFPTVDALKGYFDKEGPEWEALTRSAGLKVE